MIAKDELKNIILTALESKITSIWDENRLLLDEYAIEFKSNGENDITQQIKDNLASNEERIARIQSVQKILKNCDINYVETTRRPLRVVVP